MLKAKFSTLKRILNDLGFVFRREPGKSAYFENPDSGHWFIYPDYADDEQVYDFDLVGTRHSLDARGYLSRDEFEELLRERRAAG